MKYITFKIKLTQTSISVSTIDNQNKEEIVELNEGIKEYPIDISFNKNEINLFEELETDLLQQLLEEPKQFIKQTIEYQNKYFEVLPETLFTLIVYFLIKIR